jgi:hypothetical protein
VVNATAVRLVALQPDVDSGVTLIAGIRQANKVKRFTVVVNDATGNT